MNHPLNRSATTRLAAVAGALALLAGATAQGADQYWTGASGDYTNTANWNSTVPGPTERAVFTNAATYQVSVTSWPTNYPVTVNNGTVTFDLNGNTWTLNNAANTLGLAIGAGADVLVSDGTAKFGTGNNQYPVIAGKLQVNDSLGPVNVVWDYPRDSTSVFTNGIVKGGQIVVSGSNAEFRIHNSYSLVWEGQVLVTNKALFTINNPAWGGPTIGYRNDSSATGSVVVIDATVHSTEGFWINGGQVAGSVILSNNATWTTDTGGVTVAGQGVLVNARNGTLLLDQSSLVTRFLTIGAPGDTQPGRVDLLNGSSLTAMTNITVNAPTGRGTNTFVMSNSTVLLGSGSTGGVLSNRGVMRAGGTIRGVGAARALVRNERLLEVGSSIASLVLSNANLELAAGSQTAFEFSDTGLDQILARNGSASVLGSNVFTLTAGAATMISGVKWGLGTYDFIVASNITWNPQYENLTNLLSVQHSLVYGIDYRYGIVDLAGGLQALRLEFVPEPSTALLLVGGGLVLFRLRRGFDGQGRFRKRHG